MKFVIISDTHGCHDELVQSKLVGGVIIHCGDMTNVGTPNQLFDFAYWFSSLPIKHKICVAGNHDLGLDKYSPKMYHYTVDEKENEKILTDKGIIYLRDSEIVIDGVKFYGTPSQPPFCNWAFNDNERTREMKFEMIPNDTDVLITHCPPYGILDTVCLGENVGCKYLLEAVKRVKPRIHCFGHIHEDYGIFRDTNTTFINASSINVGGMNDPICYEVKNDRE